MSSNIFELLSDEAVSRKKKPAKEEAKSQPQKSAAKKADSGAKKAAPSKPKDANKPAQKSGAGNKGKAPAGGQRKGGARGGGSAGGSGGAIDPVEKKNRASNRREMSKDRNRDHHYKATKDKLGLEGPRGKRTYERRSGTGRPANENKKGGSGRGNWGRNDGTEQIKAVDSVEGAEESEARPNEEVEAPREEKEEDKTMTLEEYRKSQASVRVKSKAKKARQANEGEDKSKWADYTPLTKEDEVANAKKSTETKKEQKATQENNKKSKKKAVRVPLHDIIDTRANKPRGKGRGGQGFDKKPARGKRGDKPAQGKELALNDQSSFPALG